MAQVEQSDQELVQAVLEAFASISPFTPGNPTQAFKVVQNLARASVSQPAAMARFTTDLGLELGRIAMGVSRIDLSADRRFSNKAYLNNPVLRRVGQQYLAWSKAVHRFIDDLDLDEKTREQAQFTATMITESLAPTNTLVGNPAALQEAINSRGRSLASGFNNWVKDQLENGGMPAMVDSSNFIKGKTIAATPGEVVSRTEVVELIRYTPQTPDVSSIPLVIIPPQINKYYVLDMAPGRSLIENAVKAGQQVFTISWRNPGPPERDWDLDRYVTEVIEATSVALNLAGADEVNLLGVCAGGMTMGALLGYLQAIGDHRVHTATYLVAMLDWSEPSAIASMIAGPNASVAIASSKRTGVLSGDELTRLFAWMRPNDLVWNYWSNNYLMGRQPAAFDILAWNVDSTNLPAALHQDFVEMADTNALAHPNEVEIMGRKIDLGSVTIETYVVGGLTDHITQWKSCYMTTRIMGGPSQFVLAKSGHVQTLVSPLDNPKSRYYTNEELPESPDSWLATATEHNGSWISHWLEWLGERSGSPVTAPKRLDSKAHPSQGAAPGLYING